MESFIRIEDLKKYFPVYGGVMRKKVAEVKAVDKISFDIYKGETFGVVGESGCGKTTLGKTMIRLLKPNAGHIFFKTPTEIVEAIRYLEKENPKPLKRLSLKRLPEKYDPASKEIVEAMRYLEKENPKAQSLKRLSLKHLVKRYDVANIGGGRMKKFRRYMQIVYQDPTTSLDPRMLIKDIVAEPIVAQGIARGPKARERVIRALEKVGLGEKHLFRYPHEFSGGQRQRIAVARAIISEPEFIVLDEPTSAVDVSVRAQLLNLFLDLQKDMGLTYMFISHDLSVVECISNRVAVMYLGKIVEQAKTSELYKNPLHPYAQALFASIPVPDPSRRKKRAPLSGEVPSPVNPPAGCRFHPRCPLAMEVCRRQEPPLVDVGGDHLVACFAVTK